MPYDNKKELADAMTAAEEAFEDYLSEEGLDAAYFDLRLEGYTLNHDFTKPLNKIVYEANFEVQESD